MRQARRSVLMLILLCAGIIDLPAQVSIAGSGGDATGAGGTVSYTIGQTDYIAVTGAGGAVLQGVQQPYEIFGSAVEEIHGIELTATVAPNPATESITLSVTKENLQDLAWSLFDLQGQFISGKAISDPQSIIPVAGLSSGIYFLKISQGQKEVKSFKIIKNR